MEYKDTIALMRDTWPDDMDARQRCRKFLAGCMESGIDADQAWSHALTLFASVPADAPQSPRPDPAPAHSVPAFQVVPGGKNPRPSVSEVLEPEEKDLTLTEDEQKAIKYYRQVIPDLTRQYIDNIRQGDTKRPEKWINDLLFYIADHSTKTPIDIYILDAIWDLYRRLCSRLGVNPTIHHFADLVSLDRHSISRWRTGEAHGATPSWSATVKKWYRDCEAALSADLQTSDGASPNKMFIGKVNYGWCESAPVQRVEVSPVSSGAYPVLGLPVSD